MPNITAAQIIAENDWDGKIDPPNMEYLIDNIINYVNLVAGLSIGNLAGAPGVKTVAVTNGQDVVLKSGMALAGRAYLDKGPNTGTGGISVVEIVNDPHYKVMSFLFKTGISRLRGRSFERV